MHVVPTVNLRLDFEVVSQLHAVVLLGDKDQDGSTRHELDQATCQPLPLEPAQCAHLSIVIVQIDEF